MIVGGSLFLTVFDTSFIFLKMYKKKKIILIKKSTTFFFLPH